MEIFLKRGKGSITVLVTLLLVPTIFFTSFLVDLARIKLYSNQAVMTADNYGDAVLSQFDNILKDLYGLFAVTQDEEGLQAVENLEEYMKSSFDPTVQEMDVEGFMPYKSANVSMEYEFINDANLGNDDVFVTQIADFMKFRIAQVFIKGEEDGENAIIEAMEQVEDSKSDAEVTEEKLKLDKKLSDLLEELEIIYNNLNPIYDYPTYFSQINDAINNAKSEFNNVITSDSFRIYRDYKNNQSAIQAAREKEDRKEEYDNDEIVGNEISLTEDDYRYLDMGEAYDADSNAREDVIRRKLDNAIEILEDSVEDFDLEVGKKVDFEHFDEYADDLLGPANKVAELLEDIEPQRDKLLEKLNQEGVSEELKNGIMEDLAWLNELLSDDNYNGTKIKEMVQKINQNKSVIEDYKNQVDSIHATLENVKNECVGAGNPSALSLSVLDTSRWYDFTDNYSGVYNMLKETFGDVSERNKEGKKKKKEASKKSQEFDEQFNKDEEVEELKNIPTSFNLDATTDDFDVSQFAGADIFKDIAALMNAGSIGAGVNEIVDNLYLVAYDTGMFSSRVTNVEEGAAEETLVGTPYSNKANYLYKAEMEYLLSGHYDSNKNLTDTRNRIVSFRFMMNFVSTYKITELNTLINSVSSAIPSVVLKIAVNSALHIAIAGMESAQDWNNLKEGKKAVLLKKDMSELETFDDIMALLGEEKTKPTKIKNIELSYEDYLLVMLLFMTSKEDLSQRTANLISINVSYVRQNSPDELSELTFRPENAHTAVKASCNVHMDFVVMPKNFAKQMTDDSTYQEMEEFEKNSYKYTVTRGY